ncbi:MAG TPA: DUF805 domain-containing protein [Thermodesulfobacteriota bacterium]|nr:DUF805 domain-containing protein [Thermodesulfobacteriota bacterium]
MNWYIEVLKKYAVFGGRARRKEYWIFSLIHIIVCFVLTFIDSQLGLLKDEGPGVIGGLYILATLIPNIAVSIRRVHDVGKSGWWLLILFVPFIGGILLLYYLVKDSDPGQNQYGPNPKGESAGVNIT